MLIVRLKGYCDFVVPGTHEAKEQKGRRKMGGTERAKNSQVHYETHLAAGA